MELTHPDKIFQYGVSPSMVTLWLLCKHKWWLHYIAQQGRMEREAQKDSGTAFHNFLQLYYNGWGGVLNYDDYAEFFKQDFPEEESTEKRPQDHCLKILRAYLERYPRESEPFEPIEREQAIQAKIEGCVLPLNVKIDMTVEWRNGLWVMDHKTSNNLGSTYFDQFVNNWQTYCYIYATQWKYKRHCEGIVYNAIGMKKKIDNDSFLRMDVSKTQDQLECHIGEWRKHANEMYEFVQANWQDGNKFLLADTPHACRAYFTNCPFTDYCQFNKNERMLS